MSDTVFVTVVLGVIAGNVAMMGLVVKALGDRIGDLAERVASLEARTNERFDSVETRLDGIGETLARFDERLKATERRS